MDFGALTTARFFSNDSPGRIKTYIAIVVRKSIDPATHCRSKYPYIDSIVPSKPQYDFSDAVDISHDSVLTFRVSKSHFIERSVIADPPFVSDIGRDISTVRSSTSFGGHTHSFSFPLNRPGPNRHGSQEA